MLREVDAPDANPQRALPRTKGEILPLTSFRAWAALLVVAHHDLVHYHQSMLAGGVSIPIRPGESAIPWHVGMLSEARVGVTMFFVLSGFLLTLRYWTAPFDAQGWKNYLAKRVARIWPLYLAVCALQFAFEVYKGHEGLIHYVSYFTLTQGFFGDIKFWGVSTAWSLTVEECFYLVLPLLLLLFRRFEPAGRTSGWRWYLPKAAVVAATTGALALIGYALARQPWFKLWGFFESEGGHWVGYTICGRFVDFAAGILAALIYLRSSNRALANPLAANAGFVAGALLLLGSMHLSFYYPFQGPFPLEPYHPLSVLASALLVYFLCAPTSFVARAASARWMVYLGKASFALYLLHAAGFVVPIYRRVFALGLSEFAEGVVCGLIAIAIAILFYEFVEKPGQRGVLRWWNGRKGDDDPQAGGGDETRALDPVASRA